MYVCEKCHDKDKDIIGCRLPIEFHDKFDDYEEGEKRCWVCGKWYDELYHCPAYSDYRWEQEVKKELRLKIEKRLE